MKGLRTSAIVLGLLLALALAVRIALFPNYVRPPPGYEWIHEVLGERGNAIFVRGLMLFGIAWIACIFWILYMQTNIGGRQDRENRKIDEYLGREHRRE
jgi:hypothetical protein